MIGKDSRIPISKQSIVSLLVVIGLLAMAIPAVALPSFARADERGVTGTITLGNSPPTVDNVTLWSTVGEPGEVTAMTPQVQYNIKVTVTDLNQLEDLTTITVRLFHDANGTYGNDDELGDADNQTRAIFTWAYPDSFSIDSSMSGGTWSIGSCFPPDLEQPDGTFEFLFTPGKVATQTTADAGDKWHIHVVADDGKEGGTGERVLEGLTMNWYGQITTGTSAVAWSSVTAGVDFADGMKTGITMTYITNGAYLERVAATDNWSGAILNVSGNPGPNEFSLKANNTDNLTGAELVTAYSTYVAINNTGSQTTEGGVTINTYTLYLKLGSPFAYGEYVGTIYFEITNKL